MTPARTPPKAPRHLSAKSRRWWDEVVTNWDGLESHHLKLLQLACEASDRAEEARKILTTEGPVYHDRFGAPRRHPATQIEAEARTAFQRIVRALNLDESEPKRGRNQWRPKPPRRP